MRTNCIRVFAFVFIGAIVLDTLPGSWSCLQRPKFYVSQVLKPIGLAQGEWTLFSPNPDVDNGWFSAEIVDYQDVKTQWMSPIWSEWTIWEKFYQFRHINFYNRLATTKYMQAWDDFADYLGRQYRERHAQVQLKQVSLYRNSMRMLPLPDDGTLPPAEDLAWMTSNEFLTKRTSAP